MSTELGNGPVLLLPASVWSRFLRGSPGDPKPGYFRRSLQPFALHMKTVGTQPG